MAVSEISKPHAEVWPLSIEAYHALGDLGLIPKETELLYGQVFYKMSKSPLHSALVRRLLRLLQPAVPSDCFLSSEQPITCSNSEPEPDVAVVRGAEKDFWRQHPSTAELVVEVCVTSHEYDRSKVRAYAQAGVKEVWFVLGLEKQIEVHRQPCADEYAERIIHGPGGTLVSNALPAFHLDLGQLFEN